MTLRPASCSPIPDIPEQAQQRLFGFRAMGRYQQGSDIDLCLDDLLQPWPVDVALRHELPADLEAYVQRVGRCIWRKP
jgi:uncharacterized protein